MKTIKTLSEICEFVSDYAERPADVAACKRQRRLGERGRLRSAAVTDAGDETDDDDELA